MGELNNLYSFDLDIKDAEKNVKRLDSLIAKVAQNANNLDSKLGSKRDWLKRTDMTASGATSYNYMYGGESKSKSLDQLNSKQLTAFQGAEFDRASKSNTAAANEEREALKKLNSERTQAVRVKDRLIKRSEKQAKLYPQSVAAIVNENTAIKENTKVTDTNIDAKKKSGKTTQDNITQMAVMGYALMRVGTMITNTTRKITAFTQANVESSLSTGNVMGQVQSLMDGSLRITTERAEQLREVTKGIAVDYNKDFEDIGKAVYDSVSAFGDSEETMLRVNTAAKMAKAGWGETSDAMSMMIAIQKSFGQQTKITEEQIGNLAFTTIKYGVTTLPELAKGMQKVSPFATRLGINLQETLATIVALSGATGKTNNVATQLTGAFSMISKSAGAMGEVINSLGFDDGKSLIASEGVIESFRMIEEEAQRLDISLEKVYGRKAATVAGDQLSNLAVEKYAEALKALYEEEDALQNALERVTGGINEQQEAYQRATKQIEIHKQSIGEKLMPVYARLMEVVASIIGVLDSLSPFVMLAITVGAALLGVAGAAMTAAGGFFLLIKAMHVTASTATILKVSLGGIFGIVGIAITTALMLTSAFKKQNKAYKSSIELQTDLEKKITDQKEAVDELLKTYSRYGESTEGGRNALEELLDLYPKLTKSILENAKAYGVEAKVMELADQRKRQDEKNLHNQKSIRDLMFKGTSTNINNRLNTKITEIKTTNEGLAKYGQGGMSSTLFEKVFSDTVYDDLGLGGFSLNGNQLFNKEDIEAQIDNSTTTLEKAKSKISRAYQMWVSDVLISLREEVENGNDKSGAYSLLIENILDVSSDDASDQAIIEAKEKALERWIDIQSKIDNLIAKEKAGYVSLKDKDSQINSLIGGGYSDTLGANDIESVTLRKYIRDSQYFDTYSTPESSFSYGWDNKHPDLMSDYKLNNKMPGPDSGIFAGIPQETIDSVLQYRDDYLEKITNIKKELILIDLLEKDGNGNAEYELTKRTLEAQKELLNTRTIGQYIATKELQELKEKRREIEDIQDAIGESENWVVKINLSKKLASLKYADAREFIADGFSIGQDITTGIIAAMEGDVAAVADSFANILKTIPMAEVQMVGEVLSGLIAIGSAIDEYSNREYEKRKAAREKEEQEAKEHIEHLNTVNRGSSMDDFKSIIDQRRVSTKEELMASVADGQEYIDTSKKKWTMGRNEDGDWGIRYGLVQSGYWQDKMVDSGYKQLTEALEAAQMDNTVSLYGEYYQGLLADIKEIEDNAMMTLEDQTFEYNMNNGGLGIAEQMIAAQFNMDDPMAFEDALRGHIAGLINTAIAETMMMESTLKNMDESLDNFKKAYTEGNVSAAVSSIKQAFATGMAGYDIDDEMTAAISNAVYGEGSLSSEMESTTNNSYTSTRVPDIYIYNTVHGSIVGEGGLDEFTEMMVEKIEDKTGTSSTVIMEDVG